MNGYQARPPSSSDPIVCTCGKTLGTRALTQSEQQLAAVMEAHAPEHKERMAHQTRHRSSEGECSECP